MLPLLMGWAMTGGGRGWAMAAHGNGPTPIGFKHSACHRGSVADALRVRCFSAPSQRAGPYAKHDDIIASRSQ